MQSNRDVALRCIRRRFQQAGVVDPSPDPTSGGQLVPTGLGRPSALSSGGLPRCRRLRVYGHETQSRHQHGRAPDPWPSTRPIWFGQGKTGFAAGPRTISPGPGMGPEVLASGKHEVQEPKRDRPTMLGQPLGGKGQQGLVRDTIIVYRQFPSVPYHPKPPTLQGVSYSRHLSLRLSLVISIPKKAKAERLSACQSI